ncbi:MAG: T9SS type A sorting domain-containing protein [Calditrichaeota bacterium]|jgi:hypothetical protein|nr:T9SS type A sorting domain-containing protein [Calditrichota bacterium]
MHCVILLFICLSLFASAPFANILNIPDDHETIQQGLNTAEDGDTVLVQEGQYVENLVFPNDRSVTLASTRLFEEDDGIIERTVIDGNRNGSVITMRMENDAPVTIIGFTITNGRTQAFGGGLFCSGANVTLQWIILTGNYAQRGSVMYLANSVVNITNFKILENRGGRGGSYLGGSSELNMNDGFVADNIASRGGVVYSANDRNRFVANRVIFIGDSTKDSGSFFYGENADVILERVLIAKSAGWFFGLIYAHDCGFEFNFVTITGIRSHQVISDAHFDRCEVSIRNSIARHNRWEDGLYISNTNSEISTSYSTGMGGFNDGEGVIQEDPQFVDFDNNDFNLLPGSPCIDTGDPESDLDPDGTRADMGAFLRFRPVYLHGSVTAASNNEILQEAEIVLSTGKMTTSNEQGLWHTNTIPGDVDVTCRADSFLDSTIRFNNLDVGDTIEVEIGLLRPEFITEYDRIEWDVHREESADVVLTLSNPGDGAMPWSLEILEEDSGSTEPWEHVESHQVFDITGDNLIRGVVRVNGLTYISGDRAEPPQIYIINDNGELVDQFQQPGDDHRGIKGMTWDGDRIWGITSNGIIGFDIEGDNVEIIEIDLTTKTDIAFDPIRGIFWTVYSNSDIKGFDRNGQQIEEIPNDALRLYGITYNEFAEDEFCLVAIGLDDDNRRIVSEINPETLDIRRVAVLSNVFGFRPCGAFITRGFSDRNALGFVYIENVSTEDGGDRLDIYILENNIFWINSNTSEGILEPESSEQIVIGLNTVEEEQDFTLPYGSYGATLRFNLDALRTELYIPISMNVVHPDGVEPVVSAPEDFSITSISPNPFNSKALISYNLPGSGNVRLSIHDIQGREIVVLEDGKQMAGQQSMTWKADGQPSGLYLCKIEAGDDVAVSKLILVK